jgi:hypothetical protein
MPMSKIDEIEKLLERRFQKNHLINSGVVIMNRLGFVCFTPTTDHPHFQIIAMDENSDLLRVRVKEYKDDNEKMDLRICGGAGKHRPVCDAYLLMMPHAAGYRYRFVLETEINWQTTIFPKDYKNNVGVI